MNNYSSGEKSRARAMIIGVVLLLISIGGLVKGIEHHDKFTAGFALVFFLISSLGLYSATH